MAKKLLLDVKDKTAICQKGHRRQATKKCVVTIEKTLLTQMFYLVV